MRLRHCVGMLWLARLCSAAEPVAPAEPPASESVRSLDAFVVRAAPYVDPLPPLPQYGGRLNLPPLPRFPLSDSTYSTIDSIVFTAARRPQAAVNASVITQVLLEAALRQQPALTLDSALGGVPSFTAADRRASLSGNITPATVSLRGVGADGASRARVLLDGVPFNDPADGGVRWTQLPRVGLARAEIVSGGGGTAWGDGALAGTIQLFTQPVRGKSTWVRLPPPPGSDRFAVGEMAWATLGSVQASVILGDFGTRSFELAGIYPAAGGLLQVLGRAFATDGFPLVAPEHRGPVDTAAWSRHRWATARWRQPIGRKAEFTATARGFAENRGGGTAYTRSGAREKFLSAQVAGAPEDFFTWQVLGYLQDQSSAARFSTVDARREAETPARDRFALAATALGATWTGIWWHPNYSRQPATTAGGDLRYVRAEARENFDFTNGSFARQRVAGGKQTFVGFFFAHDRELTDPWRATFGARIDAWREGAGHGREMALPTGTAIRDQRFADRNGVEFTPNAGLVWKPGDAWRLRAHVQRGFRRPTPSELYWSEYDGPRAIEPNPSLRTERVTSGELGAEWSLTRWVESTAGSGFGERSRPTARVAPESFRPTGGIRTIARTRPKPPPKAVTVFAAGTTLFTYDIDNFISAVAGPSGPEPGVEILRRTALERVQVRGAEASARWAPFARFAATAGFLYNDATVRRAPAAVNFVGKRTPNVPRRRATLGIAWQAPYVLTLTARGRWTDRHYDDIENLRSLDEATLIDVGVARPLSKHVDVFLTIENFANARVETARRVDGVVTIGAPRFAFGGLRGRW